MEDTFNNNEWINEFRKLLFPIRFSEMKIEDAFLLKEKHLPKSIFKFRKINDHSKENIENDAIWLSNPHEFNDPYDCSHTLNYNSIFTAFALSKIPGFDNLKKQIPSDEWDRCISSSDPINCLMRVTAEKFMPLSNAGKNEDVISQLIALNEKWHHDNAGRFSDLSKELYRVCTFSENLKSILMWSHYADNHKGFCIEYDVDSFDPVSRRILYPVIYQNELLDLSPLHRAINNGEVVNNLWLIQAVFIKSCEWKYEREWRMFQIDSENREGMEYRGIKPSMLYLGSKMSPEDKKDIIEIARKKKIPFLEMKVNNHKFEINPS